MDEVECPRCGLTRNVKLHMIVSGDGQACPRCLGRDDIEIPMFIRKGAAQSFAQTDSGWHLPQHGDPADG